MTQFDGDGLYLLIDSNTTIENFKKELSCNRMYYHSLLDGPRQPPLPRFLRLVSIGFGLVYLRTVLTAFLL
jgi:hypothetical protein